MIDFRVTSERAATGNVLKSVLTLTLFTYLLFGKFQIDKILPKTSISYILHIFTKFARLL